MTPINNKLLIFFDYEHLANRWPRALAVIGLAATVLVTGGCDLQPAYTKPNMPTPAAWTGISETGTGHPSKMNTSWWLSLGDNAINTLTEAALLDNPTLLQALTRIDEARATLGISTASAVPTIEVNGGLTRAQSRNTSPLSSGTTMQSTSTSIGPTFSWEIDLFGRVRQSILSAQNHLDARSADASLTRLTLAADVANGVLSLRACENTRHVLIEDIESREKTLELTRLRLITGFAAPVDEARIISGIATSRTNLAAQEEQCVRQVNALVALSGKDPNIVRNLIGITKEAIEREQVYMPEAPATLPDLPASVVAQHPNVISAEREVAAAWADIAVARADRLPRLDLAASLTGQWIRSPGFNQGLTTWSVGPSLVGTLFDGGAGASNVRAADARYRRALGSLQSTLRTVVQDVENALAAQSSAKSRLTSTQEGVFAAKTTFLASEAQWKAGAISLFELEDSRRQYASAQDAEISARRDQAQAWIALVKATGAAVTPTMDNISHE